MSHSYYLTPIEPSFQHLSIRPLEQTVKFVCSSLNVTNPKNPKAFKMHPQPNKLFQTYQNQLIFRLQVVRTLFKISVQPFHICVSKVYLYLTNKLFEMFHCHSYGIATTKQNILLKSVPCLFTVFSLLQSGTYKKNNIR